jgi:excisionase family DNA binding protein
MTLTTGANLASHLAHPTSPAVLRIKPAAEYLGISRAFLYQLFDRGELRRVRLGGRAAGVLRVDLDNWLAAKATS